MALALLAPTLAAAQTLPSSGCPVFHCQPEATGWFAQPFIGSVLTSISNATLGSLPLTGCAGDGVNLACLFEQDLATGTAAGTLKLVNATTLQPLWGSAGTTGSYNLVAATAAGGQSPVVFANGNIAAGDSRNEVLYSPTGVALSRTKLTPGSYNLGMTPVSTTYGVVSEGNAVLTSINLGTWQVAGVLTLTDPVSGAALQLISPSSGTANTVYAIAWNAQTNAGYLFSIGVNPATGALSVNASFAFSGRAQATPVILTTAVSGLAAPLILQSVPGLSGQGRQNQLLALSDTGSALTTVWSIPAPIAISVSPVVDPVSLSVFYELGQTTVYQANVLTGAPIASFNLKTIGGFAGRGTGSFTLNSHMGASTGGAFTLLLAASVQPTSGSYQEYVIAFQPLVSPTSLLWAAPVGSGLVGYTAQWNVATSSQPGILCPIVIAVTTSSAPSTIQRLCDF